MSFKGFQKTVVRFRQKFNIGEQTKDPVYIDAERRFQDLEVQTKKLHEESKRYADAINGMLSHQIEFSKAMTEVYKPISGSVSDPDSFVAEGNVEGIRACEEYEAVVKDLQDTLAPELEMIESRIVQPAEELLEVIKAIRKCAVKREHKKLDYDRHRTALKKLQDKKEKSLKDEKAMYKAESELEQSTQDFEYFNDLLKDELPKLFALERAFIQPLFQSFYYMQLNVFYTLHEKMQQCDIGYFDLTLDVEEAFHQKRGDVQERAEALSIVKFKTTGGRRPGAPSKYGNRLTLEGRKQPLAITAGPSSGASPVSPSAHSPSPVPVYATASSSSAYQHHTDDADHPPPPYTADGEAGSSGGGYAGLKSKFESKFSKATSSMGSMGGMGGGGSSSAGGGGSSLAAAAAAKSKPPPPKPKPKPSALSKAPNVETVTALYDYAAAQDGDLSFSAGERIEVVSRTDNPNEWWTGRVNGRQGQFPGNYVQLNG